MNLQGLDMDSISGNSARVNSLGGTTPEAVAFATNLSTQLGAIETARFAQQATQRNSGPSR